MALASCGSMDLKESEFASEGIEGGTGQSTDLTAPTISLMPTDAAKAALDTTISIAANEQLSDASVRANTDTTCSGSLQLSTDGFQSCVAFASAAATTTLAADGTYNYEFSPATVLDQNTQYILKGTEGITDLAGNARAETAEIPNQQSFTTVVGNDVEQVASSCTVLCYGLLAYYPFNGNANDESGNNHHGVVNEATLTADQVGTANKAYEFNADRAMVSLPLNQNLSALSKASFSVSAWVKVASYPVYIADQDTTRAIIQDTAQTGINVYTSDSFGFNVNVTSSEQVHNIIESTHTNAIPVGSFHHVASVFDTTALQLLFYVDGELKASRQLTSFSGNMFSEQRNWTIGAWNSTSLTHAGSFKGVIDQVRIYERALTVEEITTLIASKD